MTRTVLTLIMIVVNLIPIIGPSLISHAIGRNIQRHRLTITDGITPIVLGTTIFYLIIGLWASVNNLFFYAVLIGFISNLLFSITLYFIGHKQYKKEHYSP
ncbi:MAG: hypothetical protein ACLFNO_01810 [Parcubacteria group bacterium]